MIFFNCDYNEGAHPRIIKRLAETNLEQTIGYGEDPYCNEARMLIKEACGITDADVHFLVGGTQANLTVIAAALRTHQAVLCADSGHINVHETGAIEACGHKAMALPGVDGKITAEQVEEACRLHWSDGAHEHMTQPKMVYISHPTEFGTLYTKEELEALYRICRENGLYLFLDGARMGYGLQAPGTDVDLKVIAANTDAFYIGGTKVGALFGEAVVLRHPVIREDFRYIIKQKGGMLAKGRLLGIQFQELFRDGLYFEAAQHAIDMAMEIKEGVKKLGYSLYMDSMTNQQFVIMPHQKVNELREKYAVEHIGEFDEGNSIIRICTSWATKKEDVESLLKDLER